MSVLQVCRTLTVGHCRTVGPDEVRNLANTHARSRYRVRHMSTVSQHTTARPRLVLMVEHTVGQVPNFHARHHMLSSAAAISAWLH